MFWRSPIWNLCSNQVDTGDANLAMIINFMAVIVKSKHFKDYAELVPGRIFDTQEALDSVLQKKNLDRENIVLVENVTRCLESVRVIHVVYAQLDAMRQQAFDPYNQSNSSMLECLWLSMKGSKRLTSSLISSEWTQIGFQGSDPGTDFRSMGVLALYQLLFFSQRKTDSARLILLELSSGGYPFALVGIHMSLLVMELLSQRRLHRHLVQHFGNLTIQTLATLTLTTSPILGILGCVNFCADLVHDVYCSAFEEFYLAWVMRKPDCMSGFPELYNEVRAIFHDRFPPIA
ncbi:ELMO/CED-12 family-domain-containing protein [Ochromonadaceae sp. CCMP2298]|nr:ELMO/CED-12 family-domain-containing protein [Ochromonadaceae sp. CCMP2298]